MIKSTTSRYTGKLTKVHDEPIFRLKIPESEKYANEKEWFKEFIDYLVPYDTTVVSDYKKMKLSYDLLNSNLEGFREDLDKFCNPLGEEEVLSEQNREQILPYNRVYNKFSVLIGELLKRNDDHKPVLLSDKSIKDKNKALRGLIEQAVMEQIELSIDKVKLQQQGLSEREIEERIQEMKTQESPEDINVKNFLSEWEIFNSRALKYCKYSQDLVSKKQLSFKHSLASDRCFIYVGWEYGEPVIKIANPLFSGFHKSPDIERVEKGDYFWYKQAITLADVYNDFPELTDDEINRLGIYNYASNLRVDKRHNVIDGHKAKKVFDNTTEEMFRHSQDQHDKTVGQAMGSGTNRKYNNERLLWKVHIEFKAYREIIFLSYLDEYGKEITTIVPSDFTIPKDATKIDFTNKFNNKSSRWEWVDEFEVQYSAEKLWIPRRYEVTRLGQDVYTNIREVPNQPLNIENPYKDFELSYKGRIFSNLNSESISPVARATPSQFQYFFVKHLQNREMAKYQGFVLDIDVDQIPDYLERDHNNEPIPGRDKVAIWKMFVKKQGYNLYSGSQSSDGLPPSTRSPGSKSSMTGTAVELINLAQLLEYIDREIGMAMGISPQREANFSQGGNVSDNKQAITQSHHITEPYFFMHSEVWKYALNDWLKLFRIYCKNIFEANPEKKEHFIQYITPDGTRELLKVTPEILDNDSIGLFLSAGGQDQFYRDSMLQFAHAFSQNAGEGMEAVSDMIKAISSGSSPEEIHKMIQLNSEKQQQRQERLQQMQLEQAEKIKQREDEIREDEQAHAVEREHIKGSYMLQGKAIDVYDKQETLNADQDGIPDPLEAAKIMHDMNQDNIATQQKNRELDIKEKQANKTKAN